MHEKHFLIIFIFLFFVASVFLSFRQETLFQGAQENFVTISFLEPKNQNDWRFAITHTSDSSRAGTLIYTFEDGKKEEVPITLSPHEEKVFEPISKPSSVMLRYTNANEEEQVISISK